MQQFATITAPTTVNLRDVLSLCLRDLIAARHKLMDAMIPSIEDDWRAMWHEASAAISIDGQAWLQASYHDRCEYTSETGATVVIGHHDDDADVVTTVAVARYLGSQGFVHCDPVAIDNMLLRMALAGQIESPKPGLWRLR